MPNHDPSNQVITFEFIDDIDRDTLGRILSQVPTNKGDLELMVRIGNEVAKEHRFDILERTIEVFAHDDMAPIAHLKFSARCTPAQAADLVFGVATRVACLDVVPTDVHLSFRSHD